MEHTRKQKTRYLLTILLVKIIIHNSIQTLDLVPLYSNIKPINPALEYNLPSEPGDTQTSTDEFDFPATLIIFTEMKALDLVNRFRREADAYYVEAKRSTVSSIAQIPVWMYGVLVVLGWNEAMAVLFNPLYFATLLVMLVAAYVNSPYPRDLSCSHVAGIPSYD